MNCTVLAVAVAGGVTVVLAGGILATRIASGGDETGAGSHRMTVELRNWAVGVEHTSMAAGPVTLRAVHSAEDHAMPGGHGGHASDGPGSTHNLVVLKQVDGNYTSVARTRNLAVGEEAKLKLDLGAGSYLLVCDVVDTMDGAIVSHTVQGMRTELQVS